MIDDIISEENAEKQLGILIDYYDIEEPEEKGDSRDAYLATVKKLEKAIRKGKLEIKEDDDGVKVYQYLRQQYKATEKTIIYNELTGKAKVAMREAKADDQYGKIYALLGGLTGNGSGQIKALKGADLAIAESLGLLFLMV